MQIISIPQSHHIVTHEVGFFLLSSQLRVYCLFFQKNISRQIQES
jgi:hypothetical protein